MPYGMDWDEFKPNGYSGSDWHGAATSSRPRETSEATLAALGQAKQMIDDALSSEIAMLRAAQVSGIQIMPHPMVDRPMLMVPVPTWNALVAKYGKSPHVTNPPESEHDRPVVSKGE